MRKMLPVSAVLFALAGMLSAAPRDVRVANVTDSSFTVVWTPAVPETGFVRYGRDAAGLSSVAYDVRGKEFVGTTHCVVVTGLLPGSAYAAAACSESGSAPAVACATGPLLSIPMPDQIYGRVLGADGRSPEGALVTVVVKDADGAGSAGSSQPLVCLVNAEGWWTVNIGSVRAADGASYFRYSASGDRISVAVDAGGASGSAEFDTAADTPAAPVTLAAK